jgi:predicted hexulose-6-phosphate isomerase
MTGYLTPAIPAIPAIPVAPVIPVTPAIPVAPATPAVPAIPIAPATPATPAGPPRTASGVELGIYEKALRWTGSFDDLFAQVNEGGFSFVDLAIDESPEREARLAWSQAERLSVRESARRHGVQIGALCLSVHRRIAPGSNDPAMRARALEVLFNAIDLCADLGIRGLQLAGYFAYYEDAPVDARDGYVDCLRKGAEYAARRGVALGIENVDGSDINSITAALMVVDVIDSPWLQLYPDIGNLAEQGLDVVAELAGGQGHMLAIHVKDVRRGEPRRVPMGQGIVPWDLAFAELARQHWSGRIMVEMWNDDAPDSVATAAAAKAFIQNGLVRAGIAVWEPGARPRP